ncbi:hypothetical protein Tco_1125794 [Tanacetum coccineum]
MDDPNITIEEYIRLEEEKDQKHGIVFNWETARTSLKEKKSTMLVENLRSGNFEVSKMHVVSCLVVYTIGESEESLPSVPFSILTLGLNSNEMWIEHTCLFSLQPCMSASTALVGVYFWVQDVE